MLRLCRIGRFWEKSLKPFYKRVRFEFFYYLKTEESPLKYKFSNLYLHSNSTLKFLGNFSGAPYSYRRKEEIHELIFSLRYCSWARTQDGVAKHGGNTPIISWALVYSVLLWHWTSMLLSIYTCEITCFSIESPAQVGFFGCRLTLTQD